MDAFFLFHPGSSPVSGMRMLSVDVPPHATVRDRTRLRCNYELGGESLYSVKWYKDGSEFYR